MAVTMTLTYQGDLRTTMTHGPSSTTIETDAPQDNAGKGERFSPTDLVGAALLSCAVTTMAIKGAKEDIPVTTATGRVEKHMTTTPPRKIARLVVGIELPATLTPAHRARLEEIARTCPVALSLAADVDVAMTFTYA